jgi:hypothetical protein
VPSDGGAATRGGREVGEKSPGLEAGVLAVVFDIVLKSIVEKRQWKDECRHVWWGVLCKRGPGEISRESTSGLNKKKFWAEKVEATTR